MVDNFIGQAMLIINSKVIMREDLKTCHFNFKATLGEFSLNAPNLNCPLAVNWKRSSESVSTVPVNMTAGKVSINQTIVLPVNMYYSQSKKAFEDKKTLFNFTMSTPKGDKQAGVVYVQVAHMLNNQINKYENTYTLEKCPAKDTKVFISIEAELMKEGPSSDTMSVDSTILNQSAGPSTLSTMSIQSRQEIEPPIQQKQPKTGKRVDPQKEKKIQSLQKQVKLLSSQKQQLLKQLQKSRNRDDNKQLSTMRTQMVKGKQIQQKLQTQIQNLRSENVEHERELQKMRLRMQQIYDLLQGNLNSLY